MKKILLIVLFFYALTTSAQVTQVSGNQSGTWSGEVHLVGDVTVQEGDTLTIMPGTSVISERYFGVTVLGSFYAVGEEDVRISFTVADTTGYSNYENPVAGAWKGLAFIKSNDVKCSYCDFSYGKNHDGTDGGMMWINGVNNMVISNCVFHHNTTRRRGAAIYAENSTLNIHDCEVYENIAEAPLGEYTWGVGFQFLKCDLNIHDMIFHDNHSSSAYGGGMNIDSCNMELNNAVFYNNYAVNAAGLGIQRCKDYTVKVSNILAYNNASVHYGGGLAVATSDPELNNLTIVNNYCGAGGGGMQMAFNASPTLNNCIFWNNHGVYEINETDTLEYYMGSQIWLWGADCYPMFNNGLVQYGLDSINAHEYLPEGHYNDMIDADPLFADEKHHDYKLSANSPCINTGVEDITGLFIPETDLAGGPRVFNGRIDMGCFEWNDIGVNEVSSYEKQISIYPNPLNDNSVCVINLSKKTDVVLRLISLDGKEVYREDCGTFEAGENRIPLDGMIKNVVKGNNVYLLIIDNQSVKIIY